MSNDIKLTEDDIEIWSCQKFYPEPDSYLTIFKNQIIPRKNAVELKQKILDNQEKAEKYDALMNANHEQLKENISLTKTYQENKQLKEKIQKLEEEITTQIKIMNKSVNSLVKTRDENKLLKEELDGCKKFAEGAVDGYDEVKSERDFFKNESNVLKDKLERVEIFVNSLTRIHPDHFEFKSVLRNLVKILNEGDKS